MALSSYGIITGMVLPVIMFPSTFINSFSSLLIPEFSCYLAQNNTKGIKRVRAIRPSSSLRYMQGNSGKYSIYIS